MRDTIERAECPKCGIFFAVEVAGRACIDVYGEDGGCDGVFVARTYVAEDALLRAAEGVDVWKVIKHGDGSPSTVARKAPETVEAAIASVTGEQP